MIVSVVFRVTLTHDRGSGPSPCPLRIFGELARCKRGVFAVLPKVVISSPNNTASFRRVVSAYKVFDVDFAATSWLAPENTYSCGLCRSAAFPAPVSP